jgi:tRNA G18 (ribose-2'-O)-methylase SpoU
MASTGSLFALPILQVSSLLQCVALLKKQGFGVLGTALTQEAQPFSSEMFWPKSAIIVGAEGSGMKAGLIKACDTLLTIPMAQGVQSLNAATTAAIICYERYKQMSLLLRN